MLKQILDKIINTGQGITQSEALKLLPLDDKTELYEVAHQVTRRMMGNKFDTCSIINVKNGSCSENCKWCAQSAHYKTGLQSYPLLNAEECVSVTKANAEAHIGRVSLVSSGRGQTDREVDRIVELYRRMGSSAPIKLCASLGLLTREQLTKLRDVGVITYHCNMETAPSYFNHLCSTHSQQDKLQTIKWAREVGMQICSGGIIGMGESAEQRIEFACYLRDIGVKSIPINMLQAIPGTPLSDMPPLTDDDFVTTVALFRLINPTSFLRFSGGRIQLSQEAIRQALYVGINSAITGDLLTTTGARAAQDMALIDEMNYVNSNSYDWEL